jgi:uncharacterized protein with PQ loop repeat
LLNTSWKMAKKRLKLVAGLLCFIVSNCSVSCWNIYGMYVSWNLVTLLHDFCLKCY